ncbi:MAG: alkaline phosphatase [Bacteroidota bacterium]
MINQQQLLASFFLLAGLFLAACKTTEPVTSNEPPQNIILLIGDGMGLAQLSSVYYEEDFEPSFSRFQTIGLHQNAPVGAKITDSAAGATAFSAGIKSYNGAIAVDTDTMPVPTILEMAADRGLSTGVIATSSITHATPASFYAHVKVRKMQEEIAQQMVAAPVDFFAGGGIKWFADRKDKLNYLDSLTNRGYRVDTTRLQSYKNIKEADKCGFLLAKDGMPKMTEGRGDFLPDATALALDFLDKKENGFFLMVEGSQIDWGGHANDSEYIIEETKDFSKAVDVALDFAVRDGNTLVIVTADHETGGYALSAAEVRRQRNYKYIGPTFSTGGHTASLVPVFAYGPGEENFKGIYQNDAIFGKMLKALGWQIVQ